MPTVAWLIRQHIFWHRWPASEWSPISFRRIASLGILQHTRVDDFVYYTSAYRVLCTPAKKVHSKSIQIWWVPHWRRHARKSFNVNIVNSSYTSCMITMSWSGKIVGDWYGCCGCCCCWINLKLSSDSTLLLADRIEKRFFRPSALLLCNILVHFSLICFPFFPFFLFHFTDPINLLWFVTITRTRFPSVVRFLTLS